MSTETVRSVCGNLVAMFLLSAKWSDENDKATLKSPHSICRTKQTHNPTYTVMTWGSIFEDPPLQYSARCPIWRVDKSERNEQTNPQKKLQATRKTHLFLRPYLSVTYYHLLLENRCKRISFEVA